MAYLAGGAMTAGADARVAGNWTGSLRDSHPPSGGGGGGIGNDADAFGLYGTQGGTGGGGGSEAAARPVDPLAFTGGGSSNYRRNSQQSKAAATASAASRRRRRAWQPTPLPVDTRYGDLTADPPPLTNVESPSKAKVKPTRRASFTSSGKRRFTVGSDMKSLRGQLDETQAQLKQTRVTQVLRVVDIWSTL